MRELIEITVVKSDGYPELIFFRRSKLIAVTMKDSTLGISLDGAQELLIINFASPDAAKSVYKELFDEYNR